ncbi:hypothetical protein ACP3WJ_24425, partial [Salmonella enterica]|uniref:hypothetical protein n=1 Tax=Salmonella enterica TaxID=28901 RepID=UPI003CF8EC4D
LRQLSIRTTTDWIEVIGEDRKLINLFEKLEWRLNHHGWHSGLTALAKWYWAPGSRRYVKKAIKVFADHESVVT